MIVVLSTEPLSDPCTTTLNSIGTETDCGWPVDGHSLGSDGVLATWLGNGYPGWTFDPSYGTLGHIGGMTATVVDGAATTDYTGLAGATHEMVATIPRPDAAGNWYEMAACYAGPDLAPIRTQLQAMLDSVEWVRTP